MPKFVRDVENQFYLTGIKEIYFLLLKSGPYDYYDLNHQFMSQNDVDLDEIVSKAQYTIGSGGGGGGGASTTHAMHMASHKSIPSLG